METDNTRKSLKMKFVTATILLAVFTVVLLAWNVSLVASERSRRPMLSYKANVISKPTEYWTLTNPDAQILEAISNPDIWTIGPENETTFLSQVEEHNNVWKIEYADSYYEVEAIRSYDVCIPKFYTIHLREHLSSAAVLGSLWSVLGITVWKKKT